MNLNFKNIKMTIDLELLSDLPNLEVINNGNLNYFETIDITNGELTVVNIGDDSDEFYLSIKNLNNKIDGFGTIANYEDYLYTLEEVLENQKVINEKTLKRISN